MIKEITAHKYFSHIYNSNMFAIHIQMENGLHQSIDFRPEQASEAFARLASHIKDMSNAKTSS